MEKITADNWTFTGYQSGELMTILSIGADPDTNDHEIIYYMSVIDPEGSDLYQEEFSKLSDAITKINNKYGHWDLVDRQGKSASGSGCDTCAAH